MEKLLSDTIKSIEMKKQQFKTNIKCTGCLSKVSPVLNQTKGIEIWSVDLEHPDRILTVESQKLSAGEIEQAVANAGYSAKKLAE